MLLKTHIRRAGASEVFTRISGGLEQRNTDDPVRTQRPTGTKQGHGAKSEFRAKRCILTGNGSRTI